MHSTSNASLLLTCLHALCVALRLLDLGWEWSTQQLAPLLCTGLKTQPGCIVLEITQPVHHHHAGTRVAVAVAIALCGC